MRTSIAVEDAMVSVEEYHDASWKDIMSTEGCSVQGVFIEKKTKKSNCLSQCPSHKH